MGEGESKNDDSNSSNIVAGARYGRVGPEWFRRQNRMIIGRSVQSGGSVEETSICLRFQDAFPSVARCPDFGCEDD